MTKLGVVTYIGERIDLGSQPRNCLLHKYIARFVRNWRVSC